MSRCDDLEELVVLEDYDPDWPEIAKREAAHLSEHLDLAVDAVEHIGSTAVPGMAAKPFVDLLVGLSDDTTFVALLGRIEAHGYRKAMQGRSGGITLVAERDGRGITLHVVQQHGSELTELLAMRDFLRAHPCAAKRYSEEKRRILQSEENRHPDMYSGGKSLFVSRLSAAALQWAAEEGRTRR